MLCFIGVPVLLAKILDLRLLSCRCGRYQIPDRLSMVEPSPLLLLGFLSAELLLETESQEGHEERNGIKARHESGEIDHCLSEGPGFS